MIAERLSWGRDFIGYVRFGGRLAMRGICKESDSSGTRSRGAGVGLRMLLVLALTGVVLTACSSGAHGGTVTLSYYNEPDSSPATADAPTSDRE